MTTKTKKTFEYLLVSEQNEYKTLLDKVNKLQELNVLVKQHLSAPLVDHCWVANLKQGRLVLAVDSPVWATNLRFHMPELLSTLRQQPRFAGLVRIDVSVAPTPLPTTPPPIHTRPARKMTDSNRKMLLAVAETIADPRLKAVITALATNITQ
jgi:hypothetical protein